jgi:pimeloyl-ACP methyl ester carboxylesterase
MKSRITKLLLLVFFGNHFFAAAQMKFHAPENPEWPGYALKTVKLSTGVQLQYAEQGDADGEPVIFLHGLSDSWHSFEQVLPHLPASVHAYAISVRGHGNSDKPRKGYSPEDFSADIAAFIKQLKTGPAIIVGHSMGSVIAQRFALDHPGLSKALVLIGSFASFSDKKDMAEFNSVINQLSDPVDSAFIYEFQKSTLEKEIPLSELNTYISESHKLPAYVWKEAMQGLMSAGYQDEFKKMDMPVLVIWGNKDPMAPEADQHKFLSGIKNSRLIVYENTGHAVHWEQPVRFANDLLNFINQQL